MSVVSLCTWMATILAGLLLLVIWIMEYDREFQSAAATRLPVPVISAHALLGLGGLVLWGAYRSLGHREASAVRAPGEPAKNLIHYRYAPGSHLVHPTTATKFRPLP